MSQFTSSSATQTGSGLMAIIQGAAAQAAQEAQFNATLQQHQLDQEQYKTEQAKQRAFAASESTKEIASRNQMQQSSQQFQSGEADKQRAFDQQRQDQWQKFTVQQQQASEMHARWLQQNNQSFEAKMHYLDVLALQGSDEERNSIERMKLDLQAKHDVYQAASIAAQKRLEGNTQRFIAASDDLTKHIETIEMADRAAAKLGTDAATAGKDLFETSYRNAQNNLGVSAYVGEAIRPYFNFGSESRADNARRYGGEAGLSDDAYINAIAGGYEQALNAAGSDMVKSAGGKAAVSTVLAKGLMYARVLNGASRSGAADSPTVQTAKQEFLDAVKNSGVNQATLRALLTGASANLTEAAGKGAESGRGDIKRDADKNYGSLLSTVAAALPRNQSDQTKIIKAAMEMVKNGKSPEDAWKAAGGNDDAKAKDLLTKLANNKQGMEEAQKAVGDVSTNDAMLGQGISEKLGTIHQKAAATRDAVLKELKEWMKGPPGDLPPINVAPVQGPAPWAPLSGGSGQPPIMMN